MFIPQHLTLVPVSHSELLSLLLLQTDWQSASELRAYRDIAFYWKFFLNPDITVFPNYIQPGTAGSASRQSRMSATLKFGWNEGYSVGALGIQMTCRPNPHKLDPVTQKKVPPEKLPKSRYPSTATPSFYVPPPAINTEDDVIYRPNLPGKRKIVS